MDEITKVHAAQIALEALRDLVSLGNGMYTKNAQATIEDIEVYLATK